MNIKAYKSRKERFINFSKKFAPVILLGLGQFVPLSAQAQSCMDRAINCSANCLEKAMKTGNWTDACFDKCQRITDSCSVGNNSKLSSKSGSDNRISNRSNVNCLVIFARKEEPYDRIELRNNCNTQVNWRVCSKSSGRMMSDSYQGTTAVGGTSKIDLWYDPESSFDYQYKFCTGSTCIAERPVCPR